MMKKSVIAVLAVLCMCIATFQPSSALAASVAVGTGDEVIKNDKTGIPDKALYQCILDELEKKKTETFTRQEAMGLRYLEVSIDHGAVKSLKGIGYLANLESLDLGGHLLTNISGVGELKKLRSLDLEYNKLRNLKEISGLKDLEYVFAPFNRLTTLAGIEKLKKLKVLDVMDSQLTSAEEIKGLRNMERLYLNGNKLKNLSFVKKLTKLKELGATSNRLTSVKGVENLKELVELDLANNQLKKLPDMKKLTKLKLNGYTSFTNNFLTEKELRSKLPAHLLKKSKEKKEWLSIQSIVQDPNFKVTLVSPKNKGKITKDTKKISGKAYPGAYVCLVNLETYLKKSKEVKVGKNGEFTFKNLNLKKWAGDRAEIVVFVKSKDGRSRWIGRKSIQFKVKK
ncbi:leucine-rich repeat domain-containing protein [Lachnospiraceae bacterium 29-84]